MNTGPQHVSVVGSGYVGTTLAACLADFGHEVVAIDIDEDVVTAINAGTPPISEPGLEELLAANVGNRLRATTDHGAILDGSVTFLAVDTPARADGSLDSTALLAATDDIGETLADDSSYHLVVVKSTVLPEIVDEEVIPRLESTSGRSIGDDLGVAVNPEFLREGTAVADLLNPDRIVIGADDERAGTLVEGLYMPLIEATDPAVYHTGRRQASLIKYANNAFLATKLSFINDLGGLCKSYGVDTYEVAEALGLDPRIEGQYLDAGVGWGGSCLPKDTAALRWAAANRGHPLSTVEAAIEVNERQPDRLLALLRERIDVTDRRVAVLGLAFKPGTDDIRNSRAHAVIDGLLTLGADVIAYDPNDGAMAAMAEQRPSITYADSAADALSGAVAACVVTGWPEFADLDGAFDAMEEPIIIDGRRIIEPRPDIDYVGLSW